MTPEIEALLEEARKQERKEIADAIRAGVNAPYVVVAGARRAVRDALLKLADTIESKGGR